MRTNAGRLGLTESELRRSSVRSMPGVGSVVRYDQLRGGLPVLGGQVVVTVNASGGVLSAAAATTTAGSGMVPARDRISAAAASAAARQAVSGDDAGSRPATDAPVLSWYDPALLHVPVTQRSAPGPVWVVGVHGGGGDPVRRTVLVNAVSGGVELAYGDVETLRSQVVCDGADKPNPDYACTHDFARTQTGPPSAVADVNKAWDSTNAAYDFYHRIAGMDLTDLIGSTANGSGKLLRSTVRACPGGSCPYDNAFWDGRQMTYGDGYAGADDVVAHELTHGVTEHTSGLFYYQESGAINESMSDIFGELTDLSDGIGNDSPAVRWQLGEDLPGGPVRDMADPGKYGQPDRMTSKLWNPDPSDSGGVHTDSGVGNKAAQLIVDGGDFNGRQITGIGVDSAAKIYWEVENELLPGATYADLFVVLPQSCRNLVGAGVVPAVDCAQVDKAVAATEMNLEPTTVPPTPKPAGWCPAKTVRGDYFSDDFEGYADQPLSMNWQAQGDWTVTTDGNPQPGMALYGRPGPKQDTMLTTAAPVQLPAGVRPYLRFSHDVGLFDGALIVEARVDGKKWTTVTFVDNGYNGVAPDAKTKVFTGDSHRWFSSRADLSAYQGKQVYLRFRMWPALTSLTVGWWLDDLTVYGCGTGAPSEPRAISFDNATTGRSQPLWSVPVYLGDKVTAYQITASPGNHQVVVPPTHPSGPFGRDRLTGWLPGLKKGVTYTFLIRGRIGTGPWGTASTPAVLHGTVTTLNKPGAPVKGNIILTGRVTDVDTQKPPSTAAGSIIIAERRVGTTTWQDDGTTTLAKNGTFTLKLPHKAGYEYIARFDAGAQSAPGYGESDSTPVHGP